MLFDELGEIVQSRGCMVVSAPALSRHGKWHQDGDGARAEDTDGGGVHVPMASVKKANPRTTPTYPSSGNIHMAALES